MYFISASSSDSDAHSEHSEPARSGHEESESLVLSSSESENRMPFAEGVSVHDGYLESPPVLGVQLVPYTSSDGEEVDSSDEEITVRQLADR